MKYVFAVIFAALAAMVFGPAQAEPDRTRITQPSAVAAVRGKRQDAPRGTWKVEPDRRAICPGGGGRCGGDPMPVPRGR